MKKMVNISTAILTLLLALSFAACDMLGDDGQVNLDVPEGVYIDPADLKLKWDPVTYSTGYVVDIGGVTENVSGTEYSLENRIAEQKVFTVKVKAVAAAGNTEYSDSAYSTPLDCEPAQYIFEYDDINAEQSLQYARNLVNGLTIIGLTSFGQKLENIIIPEQIGNVTVTVIGDNAFENSAIITVEIPNTIVEIGSSAFSGTAIVSIVIPASVVSIGDGAFSDCAELTDVTFTRSAEDGVTTLGEGVFNGSDAITAIIVPADSTDAYEQAIEESAPALADKVTDTNPGDGDNGGTTNPGDNGGGTQPTYYTVTFDANGGYFRSEDGNNTTQTYTQTVQAGRIVYAPSNLYHPNGLTVDYWYESTSSSVAGNITTTNKAFDFSTAINQDITLYAEWVSGSGTTNPGDNGGGTQPTSYTVIFYANGGYFNVTGVSGDRYTQTVQAGQTIQAPSVAHSNGLTLEYWYESTTGSDTGTTTNKTFDFNEAIYRNVTLYAQWSSSGTTNPGDGSGTTNPGDNGGGTQPTYYNVVFDANGGYFNSESGNSTTTQTQTVQAGRTASRPSNPYHPNGLTFDGWYESTSAAGTTTNKEFDFSTAINQDVTLYAQWVSGSGTTNPGDNGSGTQPNTYTVTFNAYGGYFIENGSTRNEIAVQVQAGQTVSPPSDPYSSEGSTFDGWYEIPADGDLTKLTPFNFNTPIYWDITLYPQWSGSGSSTNPGDNGDNGSGTQPTYYNVTFNANGGYFNSEDGGTTQTYTQSIQAGRTANRPSNPYHPNGLTFDGWYESTSAAGTTTNKAFDFSTTINQDLTLYAQWVSGTTNPGDSGSGTTNPGDNGDNGGSTQPTSYTVTFYANGGYFSESVGANGDRYTQTVQAGQTIQAPAVYHSNNLTFDYWYESTTGSDAGNTTTKEFDFSAGIYQNVTLYAQWSGGGSGTTNP